MFISWIKSLLNPNRIFLFEILHKEKLQGKVVVVGHLPIFLYYSEAYGDFMILCSCFHLGNQIIKLIWIIQHSGSIWKWVLNEYKTIYSAFISQHDPFDKFDDDYPYSFNDFFSRVLSVESIKSPSSTRLHVIWF